MQKVTPFTIDDLENAVFDLDIHNETSVREDYSGRAMYGDVCFGLVTDEPALVPFMLIEAAHHAHPDGDYENAVVVALEIARNAREDSMGRSTIVYFPSWNLLDEEEEEVAR